MVQIKKLGLYLFLAVLLVASVSAGYCKDTITGVCRESVVCLQFDTLAECQGSQYCWCPLPAYNSCSNLKGAACTSNCFMYDSSDVLAGTAQRQLCQAAASALVDADCSPSDFYDVCADPGDSCGHCDYQCCPGLDCILGKCVYSNPISDLVDNEDYSYDGTEGFPNSDDSDYTDEGGLFSGIKDKIENAVTFVDKLVVILTIVLVVVVLLALLPILFIVVSLLSGIIRNIGRLFR